MEEQLKTVLISGASSGIGEATALALAARGFRVLATVRKKQDGERLERAAKGPLTAVTLDVTDAASVAQVKEYVEGLVGDRGLWGLFNNAGMMVTGPLEFVPLARIRQQFETNVFGQIALTQALLPSIRKARGRIINNSSIGGRVSTGMLGPYAASKHALEALSDALRNEVKRHGIQVSIIEAGPVATPIWRKGIDDGWNDFASFGEKASELYGRLFERVHDSGRNRAARAVDVSRVVDVVHHALTAPRARVRYVVGFDAQMLLVLRWLLPDRWMDRMFNVINEQEARAFRRAMALEEVSRPVAPENDQHTRQEQPHDGAEAGAQFARPRLSRAR